MQPELRIDATARHMLWSMRTTPALTRTRQFHIHPTPHPHFTRTSTAHHHPSAHSTTAIATPSPISATPTSAASGLDCRWPPGPFLPSLPLPLQSLPKSGVVNFKSLGYSGLRGGRSGQTEVNTRPIT